MKSSEKCSSVQNTRENNVSIVQEQRCTFVSGRCAIERAVSSTLLGYRKRKDCPWRLCLFSLPKCSLKCLELTFQEYQVMCMIYRNMRDANMMCVVRFAILVTFIYLGRYKCYNSINFHICYSSQNAYYTPPKRKCAYWSTRFSFRGHDKCNLTCAESRN